MKRRRLQILGAWIVLTVLVASLVTCGPTPTPTLPVAAEVPTATPEPVTKSITFAWTQEPDSLNPWYTDMWFSALLQQLYLCWPWEFDEQNVAFPKLVTELPSTANGGVSADGRVITMNLRDDIVWSDGTPITSADFVFTYNMIMDGGNAVDSQYPYDMIESIDAPDERTVVITFTEPYTPWQAQLWRGLLPKHVLEPVFTEKGSIQEAEWNRAPTVGCGPFVFSEWQSGNYLHFVKNENYWLGAPKLDDVYFKFVDDASQTAALIAGDADIGTFPPLSDVPSLKEAGLKVMVQSSGYMEGLFFNFREMANPGARDLKVRQAVAMAIDREAINRDLLLGLSHPTETFWDGLAAAGYVPSDIVPWKYDPEAAKALLEEAGWTDTNDDGIRENAAGEPLTLVHGTTVREIRQDIQAVLQQELKAVGIDLRLVAEESDLFFGSFSDGAACAVGSVDIMEWSDSPLVPDPDTDYWLCDQVPSADNDWGYNYFGCDETLDGLFKQQLVAIDPAVRTPIIQQIAKYMHDQVYWYGLYDDPDYWIVGPRLTNVSFSGVTPFFSIAEWDVTE
jgi:peptide/nickel transport system substrate-binding protein